MISRGQIYFVDLSPTQGREQSGHRPVLVVSSNAINRQPLVIAVVVGTSATNIARDYPTNVRLAAAESGLPRETVFLCFQIRSLDPARFHQSAGQVQPTRMEDVDRALRLSLEL